MLYLGHSHKEPRAHLLFSADTLVLSFIYAMLLEVTETKQVKKAPESRKYAEPSAAGCSEEIIPRIPLNKGAEANIYHTPASCSQSEPPASPFSSFCRAQNHLCKNYPLETSRLTTKLGLSIPLSSLSEERVMPSTCLHQLP